MNGITLWDSDSVEPHNIPNQAFSLSDVGRNKAEAMLDIVKRDTGITNFTANPHWEGQPLDGIVFSCVDSMEVRKQILSKMKTGYFIETRMGVRHGQVFTINSSIPADKDLWKHHWRGDDVIEEKSACGTSLTVGSTAQLLASHVSWQLIKLLNKEVPPRVLTICVEPHHIQVIK